jgi:hypothetical protein
MQTFNSQFTCRNFCVVTEIYIPRKIWNVALQFIQPMFVCLKKGNGVFNLSVKEVKFLFEMSTMNDLVPSFLVLNAIFKPSTVVFGMFLGK